MKIEDMRYRFSSGSQQIFPVHIDGRVKMVRFSERNQFGNSVFFTKDRAIAEAIRQMTMFKRGQIQEITTPEEMEGLEKIWKTGQEIKGESVAESQVTEDEPQVAGDEEEDSDSGSQSTEQEETVKVFANFTVAKEWVCKEFKIQKGLIRKPEALAEVAKEHGIIIRYEEL